jgi:ABC-type branched-subunit amino acid transport system permease subunit
MRLGAKTRLRRDGIALAVLTVAYLAVAVLVTNSYYQLILTLVPIWAVFGVSWNILSGYGGQLSSAHA